MACSNWNILAGQRLLTVTKIKSEKWGQRNIGWAKIIHKWGSRAKKCAVMVYVTLTCTSKVTGPDFSNSSISPFFVPTSMNPWPSTADLTAGRSDTSVPRDSVVNADLFTLNVLRHRSNVSSNKHTSPSLPPVTKPCNEGEINPGSSHLSLAQSQINPVISVWQTVG